MSEVDIKQLRYFVTVAKELHVARAAERIGIDPSRLSRTIRALEKGVGLRLLSRSTRHPRLTSAGEVFLEEAERALAVITTTRLATRKAAKLRASGESRATSV